MDTFNRTIIAEALGVNPDSRNIRFILNTLNTIEAGKIQKASAVDNDGEKALDIVAEDGTVYRMYLTSGGSVEAVENLDTKQWIIQSNK